MIRWLVPALASLWLASPLAAQDRPATDAPTAETVAVQAWGTGHPECAEWTDACVVCRRDGDASLCSTPGIACTASETICRPPKP
jgi:hypothetical protein